jgi:hypothetical protein
MLFGAGGLTPVPTHRSPWAAAKVAGPRHNTARGGFATRLGANKMAFRGVILSERMCCFRKAGRSIYGGFQRAY